MRWDYGTIYKKIRKSKHISQEEVCQDYTSRAHLSRIESNQVVPSFELNEAFAAQSIACIRQLGINDMDKVNHKGGAITLGHPVGASGSRILTTLIYELIENKGNYGIASLCIGGGMGAATLIKNANSNL